VDQFLVVAKGMAAVPLSSSIMLLQRVAGKSGIPNDQENLIQYLLPTNKKDVLGVRNFLTRKQPQASNNQHFDPNYNS
jgi:hypothetical protein